METAHTEARECCRCKIDIENEAVTLSCCHKLCVPCSRLLKAFLNHRHVLQLLCPVCLQSILPDINGVELENFDVNTVNCENCERGTATIECDNCCVHFCEKCDEVIHRSKAMRKHDRHRFASAELKDIPWKIGNGAIESSMPPCSTHKESVISHYCEQCLCTLCNHCLQTSHSEHTHTPIDTTLFTWRQEIYDSFLRSTRLLDHLEKVMVSIPDLIQHIGIDDTFIRGHASSSTPMSSTRGSVLLSDFSRDAVLITEVHRARKVICDHFDQVRSWLHHRQIDLLAEARGIITRRGQQLRRQRGVVWTVQCRAQDVYQQVQTLLLTDATPVPPPLHCQLRSDPTGSNTGSRSSSSSSNHTTRQEDIDELYQLLQGILEVDIHEQVGPIPPPDLHFSASSYLHEVMRCHGRVGVAEVGLLDPSGGGEQEGGGVGSGRAVSMSMSWSDNCLPVDSEDNKGMSSPLPATLRLDVCNMLDQVTSVMNQSHALERRIDLVMMGLGYDSEEEHGDGGAGGGTLTDGDDNHDRPLRPHCLSANFLEVDHRQVPTSPTAQAWQTVSGKRSLSRVSSYHHLQGHIEHHFDHLASLAAKRVKSLLGEVSRYARRKSAYLERQLGELNSMYMTLYSSIIQALELLQNDDSTFLGLVECGYVEQIRIDLASSVDPFAFELITGRCGDSRIPVFFPVCIASEIASHGSISGPPCPVDLHTDFDFDGFGSCVVLTWRPGASSLSGSAESEIGFFEVQMGVADFIESGPWCLLDAERVPFQTVATCSAEHRECIVPAKTYPASVLQFRIRAVSALGGVAGSWSTVSSIRTPAVFKEVFQFTAPFDCNGLLFWLGTGKTGVAAQYENPHQRGEVNVTASTSQGSLHIFVSQTADGSFCITHNRVHSWICVDIGKRYLEPTYYCLRTAKGDTWKLRNWELQGRPSKSDKWTVLSKHRNCTDLAPSSFSVAHWPINIKSYGVSTCRSTSDSPGSKVSGDVEGGGSVHKAFRYFRILQKGVNSSGDNFLVCNGIELYGMLHDAPVVVT